MALYETGTATDLDDLVDKLMDFACVTNTGFTEDDRDLANNEASLSAGDLSVQFDWVNGSNILGIHQAQTYSTPTPGSGTNDSGSGSNGTLTTGRGCHFPSGQNGPYTSYHFFTDHATAATYTHCVVEYATGLYRHFGFGNLSKLGDWTGGEYCYGHFWSDNNNDRDNPLDVLHAVPFDSVGTSNSDRYPTMRCVGLPNQDASSKYGVMWGEGIDTSVSANAGTDGNGDPRVHLVGGMRDGPVMNSFGGLSTNPVNGQVLLVPLMVWYCDNTTSSPQNVYPLGFAPDIAYVNMKNLTPGAAYTVGSQSWRVFPLTRKQYLKDDSEESWNAGIAYRDRT